ncbi:hypothetical protein CRE_15237, partial [Caenorhabditis remanei]
MAPRPPAPRSARQRIGTIQSFVTAFDKQVDSVISGARLWQRELQELQDKEASDGGQEHAVDRIHAPRIAESLQRMLQKVSELPVVLGTKVTKAKAEASESGSDPEEVESLGDTDLDIARDILLEKVTGQAVVHRSMLTDATKAIRATFHNLDKIYMDRVSVTSLVRELEGVRVPYDTSANLTHYLGVARQLYERIHEADPNFFTYHHTLSLLARMPYPVRQKCALRRENGSITPEYVFDKADSLLSEMLADEELTGICPDPKLKHQSEKTSINTVKATAESDEDDTDSSNESEADTQESEVFAYNGKRERTYNNSHKQHSNNQYKKQSYNQNQSNSSSHQNGHSQTQRSNYKNEDINVNPFTQNQNQPQANNTNQSQQQAPVQQNKMEPKQGFNQFDMNGAPSQG